MNNLLKSIFISTLPMYGLMIGILGGFQFFNTNFRLDWLGVFIGAAVIALFFMIVLIFKPVARTSAQMPIPSFLILASSLFSFIAPFMTNTPSSIASFSLALATILSWAAYLYWYSKFGNRENDLLKVGKLLPTFELENEKGEKVNSQDYVGKKTLWLFYRGNWCPLCMAQIREISKQYQELANRGVKVALVSPQPHQHTQQLAEKFQVPFDFLVDVKNKAAKQLNIISKQGIPKGMEVLGYDSDTVMPTVVMTNADGKIIFADLTDNYRVRPEPSTFLKVLDTQTIAA